MPKMLMLLTLPEDVRAQYGAALAPKFPELDIHTADHHSRVAPHIMEADILLTFAPMMVDAVLAQAPNLRWIHALGTGVDGITMLPSLRDDVVLTSTRGIHGVPMTEMAFMLMLALCRELPRSLRAQADGRWERWPARLLENKTVGIVGVGLIAEVLAPRLKVFGMEVIGVSRSGRAVPGIDRMVRREDLARVAGEIDFLIALVPYEDDTRNLIGAEVLRAMKPTAYLVNIARGGVVDEDALLEALRQGGIAGAAIDTFVDEPLPPDHPFWRLDNVIVTPHLGGFNDAYVGQALPQLETNLRFFLDGTPEKMINVVEH
jgi:phosphoglycerate dehydrogenase-like enzyme